MNSCLKIQEWTGKKQFKKSYRYIEDKKLQKILQFYRNMSPNLDEIFIILCENMSDILNI